MYGYINVENIMCYNTNRVLVVNYVPPDVTVNIKNVKGQNCGVANETNDAGMHAPVLLENTNTSDQMHNVTIGAIELIEKPTSISSIFLKDAYIGTIKKNCVIRSIRASKPMKIHTKNPFDIKQGDLKLNVAELSGQSWFTHHFWGTYYINDNAIEDKILSVNNHHSGFKQTVEITTEGQYIGFTFGANSAVYPASLGFLHGFKSNRKGSKITFTIVKTDEVIVNEIIGTWESVT